MWEVGAASGAYDGRIPNPATMVALSRLPSDCTSPFTPRLRVDVPDGLQSMMCPWLEDAEAAYAARVAVDARCHDKALLDFFALVRAARSTFVQTWAPRLVTTSTPTDAYILRHPLLNNPLFTSFKATMAEILASSAISAREAVARVKPELSHAVTAAVEAVAAGSAATTLDTEGRLRRQAEQTAAQSKAHFDVTFASLNSLVSQLVA